MNRTNDISSTGVESRILSTLLNEMDGINSNHGVFIIAATNSKQYIDDALLRPGRLDTIITIGLPNESDRYQLIYSIAKDYLTTKQIQQLVIVTDQWSCNKILQLYRYAVFEMINQHQNTLTIEHYQQAVTTLF